MFIARIGDIVTGICICNSVFPHNPYPITGVIGAGSSLIISGGLPVATGANIVNFICTSGPQTAIIIPFSLNTTAGMGFARLSDQSIGPCIQGGIVTSATSTIFSL